MRKLLLTASVLVVTCAGLNAYVLLGYVWPPGPIVMQLQLGSSGGTLIDGSADWGASAESALATWNQYISSSQFTVVRNSTAPIADGNGANNVFWASNIFGMAFPSSVLAVTTGWVSGTTRTEADVIFNVAFSWNSYPGPLRPASLIDFRRVATHEFGHVLGLDHPDQSGQAVSSIMNASISDLDHLTADDIAGAGALYGVAAVPTADSVLPGSGTGTSQTFALRYSDTAGATDLSEAWVWFSATFAPTTANSCLVKYNRAANTLFLMNDLGTQFLPGVVLGSPGVLQNTRCAIALGSSTTRLVSGSTLTVNLATSFASAFNGTKNVYMYAASAGGANSGWQARGTWTVPAPVPAVITADSVSPNSGTGSDQPFAFRYSDPAGAAELATAWVWFNATFASSSANSCLLRYSLQTHTLSLMNDAGTGFVTPISVGSISTLGNSQCAIGLGAVNATTVGNQLTLNVTIAFKSRFVGAKNVYLYADNPAGTSSGWQARGLWSVPGEIVTDHDPHDLNRDGRPDIVWQSDSTRQVGVWYMGGPQGDVFLGSASLISTPIPGWSVVAVTDIDSDGHTDLVLQNDLTRQVAVGYLRGGQGDFFLNWSWLSAGAVPGWRVVAAADLNADHHPDLVWQNDATHQVIVWYMGGTGGDVRLSSGYLSAAGVAGWSVVAVADLNADGHPDLIWQSDIARQIGAWYMGGTQGDAFLSSTSLSAAGITGWSIVAVTDFNGDGHPDLMWQHDATRQVGAWFMGGARGDLTLGSTMLSAAGVPGWRAR